VHHGCMPSRAAALVLLALAACGVAPAGGGEADSQTVEPLLTVPERTGYRRTSTAAEVHDFLVRLDAFGDPRFFLTAFGESSDGRPLDLVVVADPPVRRAAEAHRGTRPVVLVMANIHGGEVEGKEAVQELLRAVVTDEADPWPVGDAVVLFVPVYNPAGNDALGPKNRPLQHGPSLAGRRVNARGLDLNRDWMKLEAPETRSLVGLLQEWDPHVVLDLHTTNGSAHGYELTYAGVLHPGAHPELRDLLDHDWLPALRRRMLERHGLHVFDYGNFLSPEGEFEDDPDLLGGWRTFDHRPRFGNNYVGLRNRIAILSEAYAYLAFPERIAATRAFVTEVLRLAAERGSDVPAACRRWDAETERWGGAGELVQPLSAELVERGREPVRIRGFRTETDPATGETWRIASGPVTEVELPVQVGFRAVEEALAPPTYWLAPELAAVVAPVLAGHGVAFRWLDAPQTVEAVTFRVVETHREPLPFQGHFERSATFDLGLREVTLPAGTLELSLAQPLARLAFQLVDPRAEDGLRHWNWYDRWLMAGPDAELPLYAAPLPEH